MNRSISTRSIITAVAAAGAAFLSLSASARADTDEKQVTVSYERLDLSKHGDVDELYTRLQRAARNVCRSLDSRELRLRTLQMQCYEDALANAVAHVDSARLSALHESSGGVRMAARATRSRS